MGCTSGTPCLPGAIAPLPRHETKVLEEAQPILERHAAAAPAAPASRCATGCRACGAGCCCLLLLLLLAAGVCSGRTVSRNVSLQLIEADLAGNPFFGWWRLPAQLPPRELEELRGHLTPTTLVSSGDVAWLVGPGADNMTWGTAHAGVAAGLLYRGTRVEGVWEHVPPKLRGVFWMKGNGVAEELAVLQYGQWFEAEQVYIFALTPFSWAWAAGTPGDAPYSGALYTPAFMRGASAMLTGDGISQSVGSFAFGPCPAGAACQEGSTNLTYATLQAHKKGDLRQTALLPLVQDSFTLEELPGGPEPGSRWHRRCNWGVGGCACLEFGSYELQKVIGGDGAPVEPFYGDFIRYMGEVPLLIWSGFVEGAGSKP